MTTPNRRVNDADFIVNKAGGYAGIGGGTRGYTGGANSWNYSPRQVNYGNNSNLNSNQYKNAGNNTGMFGGNPTPNTVQRLMNNPTKSNLGKSIKQKFENYGDLVRQKNQERFDRSPEGRIQGGFTSARPLPLPNPPSPTSPTVPTVPAPPPTQPPTINPTNPWSLTPRNPFNFPNDPGGAQPTQPGSKSPATPSPTVPSGFDPRYRDPGQPSNDPFPPSSPFDSDRSNYFFNVKLAAAGLLWGTTGNNQPSYTPWENDNILLQMSGFGKPLEFKTYQQAIEGGTRYTFDLVWFDANLDQVRTHNFGFFDSRPKGYRLDEIVPVINEVRFPLFDPQAPTPDFAPPIVPFDIEPRPLLAPPFAPPIAPVRPPLLPDKISPAPALPTAPPTTAPPPPQPLPPPQINRVPPPDVPAVPGLTPTTGGTNFKGGVVSNPPPRTPSNFLTGTPANPGDGRLGASNRTQIQQTLNPTPPQTPTANRCLDPCIADIQKRLDELPDLASGKSATKTITIKIFRSCKTNPENDFDVADYDEIRIDVPESEAENIKQLHDRIFQLQSSDCKEKPGCYAAIPEWWQVRLGADRPQLIVQYAEVFTDEQGNESFGAPKYALTIPYYALSADQTISDLFPRYQKGQSMGVLTLADNSKLIVNASNQEEAEFLIESLMESMNPDFLENSHISIGQRKGQPLKNIPVAPKIAKFFPTGQKDTKPEWIKYF